MRANSSGPLVDGLSLSGSHVPSKNTALLGELQEHQNLVLVIEEMGDFLLFSVGRRVDPAYARYCLQLPKGGPGTAWRSLVLPRIVYLVRLILTFLDAPNNYSFNHTFDISFAQPVSAFHHMRFRVALSLHDTKLVLSTTLGYAT